MTEEPKPDALSLGGLIKSYIAIRDKKSELTKGHKEELKPYNEALGKLENHFLAAMQQDNLQSLNAGGGTAFQATRTSVTVADWDAFYKWVAENKAPHFLDHRASKSAVEEYLEETGELPPGLNRNSSIIVNVRRS